MTASSVRIINTDPARAYKASLSLSGCGFLCIYHAGVCAAIKEYVPQLLQNRISGASAGSIIAAAIVCNVCISQATSFFLSVVSEVSTSRNKLKFFVFYCKGFYVQQKKHCLFKIVNTVALGVLHVSCCSIIFRQDHIHLVF